MYEIHKVKNYRQFANRLGQETGCRVKIIIIDKERHIHYELYDKYDMVLGTLCVLDGNASFAPFTTSDDARDNEYIDILYLVQAKDFINLINVFSKIFIDDTGETL